MELASTGWHVISAALVFLLGGLFAAKIGRVFSTSGRRSLVLYVWHTLFSFTYLFYVLRNGGDALTYYQTSLSGAVDFSLGTEAVRFITALFSSVFGLSLLGAFLAYNVFGFVGLLAFDAALQDAVGNRVSIIRKLATLVIFLPSVSFWSSAIGKDSISFMAAGLALWAALALSRRAWLMAFAVSMMLLVRPHVAALMVLSIVASMLIQPGVSILRRFMIGSFGLTVAAVLVPFAANYTGLGSEANIADLNEYVDDRQSQNLDGGGGIDISSMSLPLKLATYLFRPLPFEASTIPALAASIDNMVLVLIVIIGGWRMIRRQRETSSANRAFLWIYSLATWLVLASTTANLGISVRQKWMFAPMLIYLFISVIGKPRKRAKTVSIAEMTVDPHHRLYR